MENFYFLSLWLQKYLGFMGKKIGKRDNSNTVFTQSVLLTEKMIKYVTRVERGWELKGGGYFVEKKDINYNE